MYSHLKILSKIDSKLNNTSNFKFLETQGNNFVQKKLVTMIDVTQTSSQKFMLFTKTLFNFHQPNFKICHIIQLE